MPEVSTHRLSWSTWGWSLLLLLSIAWLGYGVAQTTFDRILPAFALAFLAYVQLMRGPALPLYFWLAVAILLRLILAPAWPVLSDDLYRFVWDGRLLIHGYNPFDHVPSWYLEHSQRIPGIDADLFAQLNSPEYYTIYPPVAQAVFALSCWLFPMSVGGSMIVMKLLLLAAELGSMLLLVRLLRLWELPGSQAGWYALNPLVIVEITGNLHFEGFMIFFLLLAVWWLVRARWSAAVVALALSIASKLIPLMLLPFLVRRIGWRRSWWFFPLLGSVFLLLWAPLLDVELVRHLANSLDLYFRQFEFNASGYYLLRWVGFQLAGYNLIDWIGPILALVVLVLIVGRAILDKRTSWSSLPGLWLFATTVYLALATTVHPWYLCLPVALATLTNWRYAIVWSGLAVLSYSHYHAGLFQEKYGLIALEYGLTLVVVIFEWRRIRLHHPNEHIPLG
ncbi:MAG: hypothetical protein KDC54_21615 [Lewinella sp.]|nr:hypothetical protein [Lewinella sp.]